IVWGCDVLVKYVFAQAKSMIGVGVRHGDNVVIILLSGIEFVKTLFAISIVGGVSVLMNARYKAPEMAYVTLNADLVAIVTNSEADEFVDFAGRLTQAFPALADQKDPFN